MRKPIPKERTGPRATKFSEKIHTDIGGPTSPQSYNGKQYFITFTDDAKCWSTMEIMDWKSEALMYYKAYKARLETQHNIKIKRLQSD